LETVLIILRKEVDEGKREENHSIVEARDRIGGRKGDDNDMRQGR